ncbi:MAG: hypothetical protein IJW78_03445 [Clostridia bacterium]|nr:hypothetical protein [Clostridia bacterium]
MTGAQILDKALRLLGYTDSLGLAEMTGRIQSRAAAAVNAVYSDLYYLLQDTGFQGIRMLTDEICLPERILNDVMPYGVAAFIAQGESDGDQQQYFMSIYNSKRLGIAGTSVTEDVIPTVW